MDYFDFESIRPYTNIEFNSAWDRIKSSNLFHSSLSFLFNEEQLKDLSNEFSAINSIRDFQLKIMHPAIRNIISKSSKGLTCSGFENIKTDQSYTFIANHRDIFLDSGILQILLVEHGHDTSEITFGDNLMINSFIVDIGKINKMFTVKRNGNRKEIYESSIRLSNYMRYAIKQKKQSTWIAQRNGRTKNGHDETQIALLKMLFASNTFHFEESFKELNLVPVSISYEYEPCDIQKVMETYISSKSEYVKSPDEDLKSILAGVSENKGGIHLAIGKPANQFISDIASSAEPLKNLNLNLDVEIYNNYHLFPTNYIALDILNNDASFGTNYSKIEKEFFIDRMHQKLASVKGDSEILKILFLKLYANPLLNALKVLNYQSAFFANTRI
jgi:hypothetical protein